MRVCLVTYSIYEQDNRVMRYAETLAQCGHEVEVLALRSPGDPKYLVLNGVKITRLQERNRNEKAKISYLVRILSFFVRTAWTLSVRDLRRKYDLLHINTVPDFLVFAGLLPKLRGGKIILDIHDILPEFYASKFGTSHDSLMFKALLVTEKLSCGFADHVIIANHLWHRRLTGRAVPAEKCTPIINYPDNQVFRRTGRTRTDDKFVMVYAGTLNWHQGLDIAVKAFSLIYERVPQAEFHIYGNGPSRDSLIALAAELGLQDRVLFFPARPLREIATVVENADLVVVPKRKNSFGNEAFSTKIPEAMILGVPVIISDTDVDRYYFGDGIVRFFRGGDEQDLAAAILALIDDPSARAAMVRKADEYIAREDWDHNRWRYLEIVERLTGIPQRGASALSVSDHREALDALEPVNDKGPVQRE